MWIVLRSSMTSFLISNHVEPSAPIYTGQTAMIYLIVLETYYRKKGKPSEEVLPKNKKKNDSDVPTAPFFTRALICCHLNVADLTHTGLNLAAR